MNQFEFVTHFSSSFSLEERIFLSNHEMPSLLRLKVINDLKTVLPLRSGYCYTNNGLLVNTFKWWMHHHKVLQAFSSSKYWDEDKLALVFDGSIPVIPDFTKAKKFFDMCIYRPANGTYVNSSMKITMSQATYQRYSGLIGVAEFFWYKVIAEGKEKLRKGVDINPRLNSEFVAQLKVDLSRNPVMGKDMDTGVVFNRFNEQFAPVFSELYGDTSKVKKFSDVIRYVYDYIHRDNLSSDDIRTFLNAVNSWFASNTCLCVNSIIKELNVTAIDNEGRTASKYTLTIKFLNMYYRLWMMLTDRYNRINNVPARDVSLKDLMDNKYVPECYCPDPIHVRREPPLTGWSLGYSLTPYHFEGKLDACMNGGVRSETLVISLHPCDLITASLGNNWQSCHSFVNKVNTFIRENGFSGQGSSYSGMYHCGNFGNMTGDGFIAYIPYKLNNPQFLVAKIKRCFMWINEDLSAIRQNYFYPGRPSDPESIAFATTIRELVQNTIAPFNGTNGTQDWQSFKSYDEDICIETTVGSFGYHGYNNDGSGLSDPCHVRSRIKGRDAYSKIFIGGKPCTWNNATAFNTTSGGLMISNRTLQDESDSSDALYMLETAEGYVHYEDFLKDISSYYMCADTHNVSKHAIKVFTDNNGSFAFYHDKNHADISQCVVCGDYYLKSLLLAGRCIKHALDGNAAEILDEYIHQFVIGNVGFVIDDKITEALRVIHSKADSLSWKSGKSLLDYSPSKLLGKVLIVREGYVIVCSSDFITVQKVPCKNLI